jgi:hypothetical protein
MLLLLQLLAAASCMPWHARHGMHFGSFIVMLNH